MFLFIKISFLKIIVAKWAKTLINKKQIGRMPWHDIGIGFVSIAFS